MGFYISFKDDIDVSDLKNLTANCTILLRAVIEYCQDNKLPMQITSLQSDRINVQAVSSTHGDGRAFDVSSKKWDINEIDECVLYFNKHYKNIAAISSRDLVPRACIYHDSGYGSHLHFQVRRDGV